VIGQAACSSASLNARQPPSLEHSNLQGRALTRFTEVQLAFAFGEEEGTHVLCCCVAKGLVVVQGSRLSCSEQCFVSELR
jgi:hypothetical protein